MTVMVKKIGGSVAVVIPKAIAQEMGLSVGTTLEISNTSESIVMRKRGGYPRRSLGMLVDQIKPKSYKRRNRGMANDRVTGREIW